MVSNSTAKVRNSSVNKNMRFLSWLVHIIFRRGDGNQDELQLTKHDKMEYSTPMQVSSQDQEVLTNPVQGMPTRVISNVYTVSAIYACLLVQVYQFRNIWGYTFTSIDISLKLSLNTFAYTFKEARAHKRRVRASNSRHWSRNLERVVAVELTRKARRKKLNN